MSDVIRKLLQSGDSDAIRKAFDEDELPGSFYVGFDDDDEDVVFECAEAIGDDTLEGEWLNEEEGTTLTITWGERRTVLDNLKERERTLKAVSELLRPRYEMRLLAWTLGSDPIGCIILPTAELHALEREFPTEMRETFAPLHSLQWKPAKLESKGCLLWIVLAGAAIASWGVNRS